MCVTYLVATPPPTFATRINSLRVRSSFDSFPPAKSAHSPSTTESRPFLSEAHNRSSLSQSGTSARQSTKRKVGTGALDTCADDSCWGGRWGLFRRSLVGQTDDPER